MRLRRIVLAVLAGAPAAVAEDCADSFGSCASYITGSGGVACTALFCDTCAQAGYCDLSCGFCGPPTAAPSAAPTAAPSAAPAPTAAVVPVTDDCADVFASCAEYIDGSAGNSCVPSAITTRSSSISVCTACMCSKSS